MTVHSKISPAFEKVLKPLRSGFGQVLFFSLFLNLLVLTLPIYMMQVYDRVIPTRHLETLFFLTLIAIVAIAVYVVLEIMRARTLTRIAGWVGENLREETLLACMRARARGLDVGRRPLDEIEALRGTLAGAGVAALFDLPWLPVFVLIIWGIDYTLGVAALVAVLSMIGIAFVTDTVIRRRVQEARKCDAHANRFAQAAILNATSVIAMVMWPAVLKTWRKQNDDTQSIKTSLDDSIATFGAITKGVRFIIQISVLGLGAYLAVQGEITMGTIIAVSIMLGRALAPVDVLVGGWKQLGHTRDAVVYLNEFLRSSTSTDAKISLPEPQGNICVRGLSSHLPGGGGALVSQVNFDLSAGESLAIIGPSGAGKSSLCKALLGYLPISGGTVRIDGADIRDWRAEDLAPFVGYLPQRAEFLPGTIRDNIARFQEEASDEDVVEAARLAHIHELILSLPKGYATKLGSDGAPLSGGQQQRIGLARALFQRPRILVLDEPNANMDGDGAAALMMALQKARQWSASVIMVVHTSGMLKGADKIMALRDGRVETYGPAKEVLAHLEPVKQVKQAV